MKYRSEIDGLRFIAVVPVILFHAGFEIFSGGFVGVDVFFVISGYLITTIIINEMEQDKFSLLNFYERRARRILPALFFVLLCCLPAAWLLLVPNDMADFAASVGATAIFLSNFYFLSQVGYFGPDAHLQPLMHTWSLAIEEQFYLLFPALLLATYRKSRNRAVYWVLVVFAVSLALAEWGWRIDAERNYFHSLSRFWELLIGSMAAFYLQKNTVNTPQWLSNTLSAVGLAAILYAVFAFDGATPFPSLYALVPTVGTVLIILFALRGTLVHTLLSLRAFVGVGLISYSLYLWHQPVFAFLRHYYALVEPTEVQMLVAAFASVFLAVFTYYVVETPFRSKKTVLSRGRIFSLSASSLIFFFALGLVGFLTNGLPNRLPENIVSISNAGNDRPTHNCLTDSRKTLPVHPVSDCLSGSNAEVLLFGDSHASAIADTLRNTLSNEGIDLYVSTYNGCVPITGLYRVDTADDHLCSTFNEQLLDFARDNDFRTLVLVGRYPLYLHGNRFNNGEGGVEHGDPVFVDIVGITQSEWDSELRRQRVFAHFESSILSLAEEFHVVLVQPIPSAGWNVPTIGSRLAQGSRSIVNLSTDYDAYLRRAQPVIELFDRLANSHRNIYVANVQDALCDGDRCFNIVENNVYYYDDDHLSSVGASIVVPTIVDTIIRALETQR